MAWGKTNGWCCDLRNWRSMHVIQFSWWTLSACRQQNNYAGKTRVCNFIVKVWLDPIIRTKYWDCQVKDCIEVWISQSAPRVRVVVCSWPIPWWWTQESITSFCHTLSWCDPWALYLLTPTTKVGGGGVIAHLWVWLLSMLQNLWWQQFLSKWPYKLMSSLTISVNCTINER